MLPSRLFRNTGLPPPLRSLLIPSPSLPSIYHVQLRLRLGIIVPPAAAPSSSSSRARYSTVAVPSTSHGGVSTNVNREDAEKLQATEEKTDLGQTVGKIQPKLSITFTCTVEGCGQRSTHEFTKQAYEKGIVIVQCPGCKNRHLIADHLGWFKESTEDGKLRTIEDILRAKGETVKRGKVDPAGTIEFTQSS